MTREQAPCLIEKVVLRIHPGGAPSLEKKIWAKFLPNIHIDDSNEFNPGTIGNGGVLVFTYLSTLFYEVLESDSSLNIVGVWNDIKKDVKEEHANTFEALHSANLLFDSSCNAANYISNSFGQSSIFSNKKRHEAILKFNTNLNRKPSLSSPAKELLKIINSSLSYKGAK